MPRISKIRLTGCKYDGLRKEHENSIFDLTKNDKADHSLFTLSNGGGKGVMMQLIFQLLLPDTRWGKSNGNKVISMFYDQRNNLHPFTFHVVLEWILDTVPEKRLITGIAVKSIIKNTSAEEEEKTGLTYFLYTHEHDNKGYFTVENLPLYDTVLKEAVDMDIFNEFINNHRREFIKYSQSSVRRADGDYYRYLESRGIYRNEWIKLKEINRQEGGAGDYFKGADDNKSIFDKIIIPAISENIRNYSYDEGDNLIEMFRSNLSITKDLPILIKRETDYKELIFEIRPLIDNAELGSKIVDGREKLIDEGNDIYFILNDEASLNEGEIEKWDREYKRSQLDRRELEYKKDNLQYNQLKREMDNKEREEGKLNKEYEENKSKLSRKKEDRTLYEVNEILCEKENTEKKISIKTNEKESLIIALGIDDMREKAEELDYKIETEWDKTKRFWNNTENQYTGYMNYASQMQEQNSDSIKKYKAKVESLHKDILRYDMKEEVFQKIKSKLEYKYDPLSLLFPDRILHDLTAAKEETEQNKAIQMGEIEEYNLKIRDKDKEIEQWSYVLKTKNEGIEALNKQIQEQERYEIDISKRIAHQLLENQEIGLLSHNWFSRKLEQLEEMKNKKGENLLSAQKSIWEKSIDRFLNKEDYFIPNKDVLLLKEEISRIGVDVQTGAQYMMEIPEEERVQLLNFNSGFLYSLVIGSKRDWEVIEKNISRDMFINNMVPIFIRSEMKWEDTGKFKVVDNRSHDLIEASEYSSWKNEIDEKIKVLTDTKNSIDEDIKNIDGLIQEIGIISSRDTVLTLGQKLKEAERETEELRDRIRLAKEEKSTYENKLNKHTHLLNENQLKLSEIESDIKSMEEYMEKHHELEAEKKVIEDVKKDIRELEDKIYSLEEGNGNISSNKEYVRGDYNKWKLDIDVIIDKMKDLYKEISYDYSIDISYLSHRMPSFTTEAERLSSLISERQLIDKDISERNAAIAVLNSEIKSLNENLRRHLKDLEKISKVWTIYDRLDLPLNEISIKIDELNADIEKKEHQIEEIKDNLNYVRGIIGSKKDQLSDKGLAVQKTHSRAPFIIEEEDLNSQLYIIERETISNDKYLAACIQNLNKCQSKRIKLETNLTKIKNGYPLEAHKGKMDKSLKDKLEENPDLLVDEWLDKCDVNRKRLEQAVENGENLRIKFIGHVEGKLEENRLKEKIISTFKEAKLSNFKNNHISFSSMENHFQNELLRLSRDKSQAEDVMRQWTNRAALHVMRMIEALKNMVSSMNYTNEQGYAFPLVKLKGIERLPKDESEVIYILEEYFIQSISQIIESNKDISSMDEKELDKFMGDKTILSKALQGRYPILLVYKMSEKNEFKYARARDEYYTTWEAINKGEGDSPEGSGGQTLSVNTFVIMMIMSFKKKHIGNENPSTVLILDNPFGKASARHVLDPIFEIADKLNFQLICFAAPEIIKVELSERFPVFWELKIELGKISYGGRIIKQ